MKGLVIAGTHSGCGKTTVTLGILSALKKKGLNVQAFKAGPDFIDAGLHRLIVGKPSRNLDLWMCGEEHVRDCFNKHSQSSDISVIEGVMGMFDGNFSTAKLAQILGLPVILIVDAYGIAESVGAVIKGFATFNMECNSGQVAGVILNRVSSENHFKRLKESIQDVPVLGYLPRDLNFEIPHRHLGLTISEEHPITKENIEKLTDAVLKHIDIHGILNVAKQNSSASEHQSQVSSEKGFQSNRNNKNIIIAIAYDKAFSFYYEDNLDLLKDEGAEIVTFSPLSDSRIPDSAHALYIGGGYPELWAKELSKNISMLKAIYNWADSGKPIYAECGGLMYLSQGIYDFESNFFKMAAVFPFETYMEKGRPNLGYREIFLLKDCILGKKEHNPSISPLAKGSEEGGFKGRLRGHEFHYSEINDIKVHKDITNCFSVIDSKGQNIETKGYIFKNTLASYIHIHFGSNPAAAGEFINFIKERQWKT